MSATQQDIARRLNLSQQTVSIAFGATGRIHPDTRQRVLDMAKRLNYVPDRLAAGLRGSGTRSVGVVWQFADLIVGDAAIGLDVLQRLQTRGLVAYTYPTMVESPVVELCRQLDDLLARRPDAIVIQTTPRHLRDPQVARKVFCGDHLDDSGHPQGVGGVDTDQLAVRHRGAHNPCMQGVRQRNVGTEPGVTDQQPVVLLAEDAPPDLLVHQPSCRRARATSVTASTIPW